MAQVVNVNTCFERFEDLFSPKIIGELNGQLVMVVRCKGKKVPWHIHDQEDELFFVLEGVLEVQERGSVVTVRAGEFTIVRRGIEHRIVAHGLVKLMLFEPAGIEHTGKVRSEVTQEAFERLEF